MTEEDFEKFGLRVLRKITKAGWVGAELEVGAGVKSWGDWGGTTEFDDKDEDSWGGMIGVEV